MEKFNLQSLCKNDAGVSAYDRTYTLPDLEPLFRERRKKSGKILISSGMDAAVLGKIRESAQGQVKLDHIHTFVQELHASGIKKSTIRTYIYYCKASLRLGIGITWARDRKLRDELDRFFRSLIPRPGLSVVRSIPSRIEIAKLIALSGLRTSLIIRTLSDSGMRISELCWIRRSSVRPAQTGFYEWDITGKA